MASLPRTTARPWIAEKKPFEGMKEKNQAFYQSTAWRKISKSFKVAHPLCVECEKIGVITPAHTVDHIVPININPSLAYTWSNLQGLCKKHNASKTGRQAHDQR